MMTKQAFITNEFPKLDFYTSQILKVHGQHHPELQQVRELFVALAEKLTQEPTADPTAELDRLAEVTDNYTVPADGCEAYQATYQLLSDFHQLVSE